MGILKSIILDVHALEQSTNTLVSNITIWIGYDKNHQPIVNPRMCNWLYLCRSQLKLLRPATSVFSEPLNIGFSAFLSITNEECRALNCALCLFRNPVGKVMQRNWGHPIPAIRNQMEYCVANTRTVSNLDWH